MRLAEEKGQSAASRQHVAVMVDEVVGLVRALNPLTMVDVTVGMGGHAAALLRATDAHLIGIDRDAAALAAAASNLAEFGSRVTLRQADFSGFEEVLEQSGIPCVGAIVADLGMSSFALNDPERGFSFQARRSAGHANGWQPAVARLRHRERGDRSRVGADYPRIRRGARCAADCARDRRGAAAASARNHRRTRGLVESAIGRKRRGGIHPATRTFQALRIAVNNELESLATLLDHGPARLRVGGRMIVLAYHSLEDRPVKKRFRELVREGSLSP